MTVEELVIAAIRIAGALPVLRWALAGALIAVAVDLSDLFQMNLLDLGGVGDYQGLDKWLDLAYLATFLAVALRWSGPERTIAVALLAWRIVGFVAFEVTGNRWVLLAFPNVFEFWFIFVAAQRHYWPDYRMTMRGALLWLLPVTALKETQEYVLHGWRILDEYVAVELVKEWWRWLTAPFR